MEKEDTTKGGLLSCQYCHASLINMNHWREHVTAKHLDLVKTSPDSGEEWACTLSNERMPSSWYQKIHWHLKSHLSITCALCGRVLQQDKRRSAMKCFRDHKRNCREDNQEKKRSVTSILKEDGSRQCPNCPRVFATRGSSFYYHIKKCNARSQEEATRIQKKTVEILGTLEPIKPESI